MKKKAQLQIPGAIVDFYAIIAFVLVMFVFALLFFIRGCSSSNDLTMAIQSRVASIDANLILLNYLRTPIVVDEKNMTIADLILLRLYNERYDTRLNEESERILTPLYEDPYFWGIIVYDDDEDELLFLWQEEYEWVIEYDAVSQSRQEIPYPGADGTYMIELTKWRD